MRRLITLLLVLAATCIGLAQPQKPASAELLKAGAERAKAAADAATPETCPDLCLEAAKDFAELSNQFFVDGQIDSAQAAMQQARVYAERAGRASIQSHKRQKQTEIGLRRLMKRMDDIMKTLNFEDRPPIGETIKAIGSVRNDLLASMFGNPKKSFEVPEQKTEKK